MVRNKVKENSFLQLFESFETVASLSLSGEMGCWEGRNLVGGSREGIKEEGGQKGEGQRR